jgi:pimeloyl-ACP methyl ester carboxylesterase
MAAKHPVVLVHGAWQTAATWDLVAPLLRDAGHEVICAPLTGLEADSELTADVTLKTHIDDVVRLLEFEDLHDVTLVGHSYAGMIISAVSDRAPDRLKRLVYVDAFVPRDDQSAMELLPEPFQKAFREQARATGDGWRLRGGERQLDIWGLKEGPAREFVRSRLSDFSINCFEEKIELRMKGGRSLPRTYIACVGEGYPGRAAFARFAEIAQGEGWRYSELPTGHDCHVEAPEAFVKLLVDA